MDSTSGGSSSSRSRRRSSEELVDRISSLSDDLLLHILSFLDRRRAVLTGILSRRWRGLWAHTQSLDFDEYRYYGIDHNDIIPFDDRNGFVKFVEQSLLLHLCPNIHKFRLHFDFRNMYDSFIEKWLLFAVRRGVKQLYLDLPSFWDRDYKLPEWLFKSDSIPALLDGCPLLEDLVLEECVFFGGSVLRISSSSASGLPLKRLTLARNSICLTEEAVGLEIEAPKLQILNLSWFKMYNNSLKNMWSLREVYLEIPIEYPPPESHPILESWLKELHHVKVLKLCEVCIEVLSTPGERYQPSFVSKTKCLMLESQLRRSELPGIANLLWRSHDLENLVIKLIPSEFDILDLESIEDDFDKEYWERLKFPFPCMVSHLMTIKISGFMGRECVSAVDGVTARRFFEKQYEEIELVKFFLKNASALKKMTIHFCGKPDFVEEAEWLKLLQMIDQKLTALPRASSCAELSLLYKC
ncbi:putative F-box protein [Cinnamomum micranthum f. kanehirae]|uniref:Putative F-box protein n=1 Tax=Cinnamomum micranthum f. kanehirae TaxID=337451 RepID=A0A3S3NC19_9MAGN|nr:putative F-box protein [Cinnamomum micranthum f. kanehirae]